MIIVVWKLNLALFALLLSSSFTQLYVPASFFRCLLTFDELTVNASCLKRFHATLKLSLCRQEQLIFARDILRWKTELVRQGDHVTFCNILFSGFRASL